MYRKDKAVHNVQKVRTPKAFSEDWSGIGPPQNVDVYTDETRPVIYDADGRPMRRAIGFNKR